MIENGFYILDKSYRDLVKSYNGEFEDQKSRPIFCCLKDKNIEGLYWLIPTSDLSHRTPEQIQKYINLSQVKDIRQAYYYVGHTTRPALFKISKVFPVSDKYISHEYQMQGIHLVMQDKKQIAEINQRLQRILYYETQYPNRLEQKITAVKEHICKEIQQEIDEAKREVPRYLNVNQKFDNILSQNPDIMKMYQRAEAQYFLAHPDVPHAAPYNPSDSITEQYKQVKAIRDEHNAIVLSNTDLKNAYKSAKSVYDQSKTQKITQTPQKPSSPKH